MKVAIVSTGFELHCLRLQPHRTLVEMGRQLLARGHEVVLISDGASHSPSLHGGLVPGLRMRRVRSVRQFRGRSNPALLRVIAQESPDLVLWHLSLSSLIHQNLHYPNTPLNIGVLTSPVHRIFDILRLGPTKLSWDLDVVSIHLAGMMVPSALIRAAFSGVGLRGMITLSDTTRRYLLEKGAPADRVWVVPPGVDRAWLDACIDEEARRNVRRSLGLRKGDFVVTYFGGPSPVRGLHTTLRAVEVTARSHPQLRLLVLCRRRADEMKRQRSHLETVIGRDGLNGRVRVVDGFLDQQQLIRTISAGDSVCLPFELVPSDVPLSILEAMALEQGVITTNVACIPELVGDDRGFLIPPASVNHLAQQLRVVARKPDVARERARQARAYVAAHRTWAKMGDTLQRVLTAARDV